MDKKSSPENKKKKKKKYVDTKVSRKGTIDEIKSMTYKS
jgi:hypothetical protein